MSKNNIPFLENLHIYSALKQFEKQDTIRFHMPGHKGKNLVILQDSSLDCTELSITDCLESPTDCILQAEEDIAKIFEAKKSFLLTDGATCGIFVMLYAIKTLGGKVAIVRNSHKSVYNACSILGVEPILLDCHMQYGIFQQPTVEDIKKLLDKYNDITALLLTTPDYYGNLADVKAIKQLCKQRQILLFIDNAHGAFMQFDDAYKEQYAGQYADVWVDSLHKTTPCLTQGAILHTNNSKLIATLLEGLNIFRTTSPSYLIMASIEYAAKYMQTFAKQEIATVRQNLSWAKAELSKLQLSVLESCKTLNLIIDFASSGYSTDSVQCYLEENGLFTELNDGRYLLFYASNATSRLDFETLVALLQKGIAEKYFQKNIERVKPLQFMSPERVCAFIDMQWQAFEFLSPELAVGKIAAKNMGRTPPCFPIIVAGERITEQALQQLLQAKHTFGMQNGKLPVLKNNF